MSLKKRLRLLKNFKSIANMMYIQIHKETGLVLLEKGENAIELVVEDIESLIDFYHKNREKIAKAEEF